MDQRGPSSST